MKKVGKTTRPFRYDLNQIPYDYTMEVTNRFKGLDLIDREPEELWMEVHNTVQEAVTKTIPKKKKYKKAKWLSEEDLQIAEKRREAKGKGEKHIKGKLKTSNNAREDSTHGHHQMVNTKIRLIIFFAAKDGEALYSQQKQNRELTVAQIMIPYCKIQT